LGVPVAAALAALLATSFSLPAAVVYLIAAAYGTHFWLPTALLWIGSKRLVKRAISWTGPDGGSRT
jgi:hypothetical protein